MQSILTKLHDYAGKELKFADIDIDFLKAYEKYLREEKHNATNTILGNYKMIRKLFNDAIREDLSLRNCIRFVNTDSNSNNPELSI